MTKYNGCMYRFRSLVSHMTPATPMPVSTPHPKYAARMARAQAAKDSAEDGSAAACVDEEAAGQDPAQPETFAAYYRCFSGHADPCKLIQSKLEREQTGKKKSRAKTSKVRR